MSRTLASTSRAVRFGTALLLLSGCGQTVTFPAPDRDHPGSVSVQLARPTGTGPFPAVVLLHGGTGVEPNHLQWSSWLVDHGYVAVVVDSFRSAAAPTVTTMVGDARGVLAYLRTLPFVDGDRVAVMGFSRGGAAALAAVTQVQGAPPSSRSFRAGVMFYPPGCSYRIQRSEVPLLLLLGQLDGGSESCVDMSRRLQAKDQPPVVAIVYPNAHHAFDDARATSSVPGQGAERLMTVQYNAQATSDARTRVRTFLADHLGGTR
jgi:dienelactone hydrolase